jgi:hypothetical protein
MEKENRNQTNWEKYLDDHFLYYYDSPNHTDTICILGISIRMTNQKTSNKLLQATRDYPLFVFSSGLRAPRP